MARQRQPGWYADPEARGQWRWWDGGSWTEHAVSADPTGQTDGADDAAGGTYDRDGRGGTAGGAAGAASRRGSGVYAKRWAAVIGTVALVVIVISVALRSHPATLYWQGKAITDASTVLSDGQAAMQAVVSADEGVASSQSRCYFSLPTRSAHDVGAYMLCGPALLPWSSPSRPWFTYRLYPSPASAGVRLSAAVSPRPDATVALMKGEVLRRPDRALPPAHNAGLALPSVPRQPAGWAGVLSSPPEGLQPAPVGDLIGDWARSYRLVAFGEVGRLSSRLDQAALRDAVDPRGSRYAIVPTQGTMPLAKLLLPAKGQVLIVAELAPSPGEESGVVPTAANGVPSAGDDRPVMRVLADGTVSTFGAAATTSSTQDAGRGIGRGNLTLVASVPEGSKPVLEISDKGLSQEVSLANGQLAPGPSVLTRLGTDETLNVTGDLPGVKVNVSDASLVWFAGSDGGTVPPQPAEAYLQVLAAATPLSASFLPTSDFTLDLPGGQVVDAQALPDSERTAIVVGFLVPASFSDGTVVVSEGGRSFDVQVNFP